MVRTKVFVGNLSFQTKEAELATEFAAAGKVISANIITRGPRSLGYGFVELDSEEDAQNAVKLLNKKEINGRPINVEVAKPRDETKEKAPRVAEGENGAPRRRIRRKPVRKEGEEGEEQKETEKDGKKEEQRPEGSRPRRRPRNKRSYRRTGTGSGSDSGSPRERRRVPNEEKEESKTTLFVANLPFSLDDDAFGKVVSDLNLKLKGAHVVKKRNGRSKGYGFIEFESQEDQQKALAALNKKVIDSRELSVKVALTELKRNDEVEEQKVATPAPVQPQVAVKDVAKPAEKKTATPSPAKETVVEKKTAPAEKKTASPSPVKETKPAEKKTASPTPAKDNKPAEKTPEKPVTSEKKGEEKK